MNTELLNQRLEKCNIVFNLINIVDYDKIMNDENIEKLIDELVEIIRLDDFIINNLITEYNKLNK